MRRWALVAMLLALAGCGKSLEKQAREQLRNLDSASLGEKQVEVRIVNRVRDSAVAEVQITTGVKMERRRDRWIIREIRLGDRHWIPVERMLGIINQAFQDVTQRQLQQVSRAIGRYADETGRVPQVENYEALIDLLSPAYLEEVLRIDAWSSPFSYSASGSRTFELRSPGPDRVPGNDDDLVLRNRVRD